MSTTTHATPAPVLTCTDCGRTGKRGFVAAGEHMFRCARRRFCQWRSDARTINTGW